MSVDESFDLSALLDNESADTVDSSGMYSETEGEPPAALTEEKPDVKKELAPKRAKATGPRQSTEALWTAVYGLGGAALVATGSDIPVGRVLQFQAPVAGGRIDELIAGSWVDKLLQPIVKYQDKAEGAASLLLLPLLVGAYERAPQLAGFPMFEQIMRTVVETSLLELAPVLKKQAAKRKSAARTVADIQGLGADLGLDAEAMKDPIGAIIGGFFYIPDTETESEGT